METIHYNDVMADLASAMQEVGVRRFLSDFQSNYPALFKEVEAQVGRTDANRRLPRLEDKDFPPNATPV